MSRLRTVTHLVLACTVVGLLAAGCSSDDGDDDSAATTIADSTSTTIDDSAVFCDDAEAVNLAASASPDVDPATATEAELDAAYGELLDALATEVDSVTESAPDELSEQVADLDEIVTAAAEAGDETVVEDDGYNAALEEVNATATESCGWASAEVTGVEYTFEDLPDTLAAGPTGVVFTNGGTEPHEMIVFAKSDGVTESFDEILQLGEEESASKMTPVGGVGPTEPEASGSTFLALEAGEYMAICFLPVGGADDGLPHFLQGMKQEFTVG